MSNQEDQGDQEDSVMNKEDQQDENQDEDQRDEEDSKMNQGDDQDVTMNQQNENQEDNQDDENQGDNQDQQEDNQDDENQENNQDDENQGDNQDQQEDSKMKQENENQGDNQDNENQDTNMDQQDENQEDQDNENQGDLKMDQDNEDQDNEEQKQDHKTVLLQQIQRLKQELPEADEYFQHLNAESDLSELQLTYINFIIGTNRNESNNKKSKGQYDDVKAFLFTFIENKKVMDMMVARSQPLSLCQYDFGRITKPMYQTFYRLCLTQPEQSWCQFGLSKCLELPIARLGLDGSDHGSVRDFKQAWSWLLKAVDQKHPRAMNVASMFLEHEQEDYAKFIPKNIDRAIQLRTEAAEMGHGTAQYNVAFDHMKADNIGKALPMLLKAADQGVLSAIEKMRDVCMDMGFLEEALNFAAILLKKGQEEDKVFEYLMIYKLIEEKIKEQKQKEQTERIKKLDFDLESYSEKNVTLACQICMTKVKRVVLEPCRHCATCAGCAEQIEECPICRVTIQKRDLILLT
jgi:TPR repeat protein